MPLQDGETPLSFSSIGRTGNWYSYLGRSILCFILAILWILPIILVIAAVALVLLAIIAIGLGIHSI